MLSKFSLSITSALILSAAAGGVARAAPTAPSTDDARDSASSSTNDARDAAEAGLPASRDYANRITSWRATNEQINVAERGSPDSVDNKDEPRHPSSDDGRAEWQNQESEDPDRPTQ